MKDPLSLIKPLLADNEILEILVDSWQHVYVERRGVLEDVPSPFENEQQLLDLIQAIAEPMGRIANESNPILDLRLEDGSRVNVVIPPIALDGATMVIRKLNTRLITMEDLLKYESIGENMVTFLKACVEGRLNILVSGGTGSGKTTVMRIIAEWIPDDERIIILQNMEFQLKKPRMVRLETRPPNVEGKGEISMRDLVNNATHMRPDRILLVETLGAEAFDMLAAINTGHDGSMLSLHATSPRDALNRLETMASYASPGIPLLALREQIASAINLVLYQERLPDGRRKIIKISEVTGLQDGVVLTRDIFEFRRTGSKDGRILGVFAPTGVIPSFLPQLHQMGIDLPVNLFTPD